MTTPTAPKQRPVSPAGWASIAYGESWLRLPHLELINRKLIDVAAARAAGGSKNLLIMCPPQHGKTDLVSHAYPGWWLGHFRDDNILMVGYEFTFAEKRGRRARDLIGSKEGKDTFGVAVSPDVSAASNWQIDPGLGTMTTTGAGGSITGVPVNLFLIDDPIKGEEDAYSENFRERQWDWFTGTVMSRVRTVTSMVMIYTPWHEDDLGQRIIRASLKGDLEPWEIVRIPAIAETQDERDDYAEKMGSPPGQPDPLGREPGEVLWPQMWPIEKLMFRKSINAYQFEAMYQCRPTPKGGSTFRRDWFDGRIVKEAPRDAERCRFWDKAASQGKGDYTAGVLLARTDDGRYFVEHVARERLAAHERDRLILATSWSDKDRHERYKVRGDQDPGAAGKDDAAAFCRLLEAFDVKTAPVSGDKETRASAFAAACGNGNVSLVAGPWIKPFLDELEAFPKGKHDDQVDAASSCYNILAAGGGSWSLGQSPTSGYSGPRLALAKRA